MLLLNEKIHPCVNYQYQLLSWGNFLSKLNFHKNTDTLSCKASKNICRFYSVKEMYCKHFLLVFDNLNFISWLNNYLTKQSSTKRLNLLRTFPPQNITDGMNISKLLYLSLRRSIWNIEKRQTSINKFMGMLHKYFSKTGFIENNIFLTL